MITRLTLFVALIGAAIPGRSAGGELDGTWVVERAHDGVVHKTMLFWNSAVRIEGETFRLSKFLNLPREMKGKLTLRKTDEARQFDLVLDEFKLPEMGKGTKISGRRLPGIYRLKGERLTVCFPWNDGGERPDEFEDRGSKVAMVTLVRAPAGFKGFPEKITFEVKDAVGKPASGVALAGGMHRTAEEGWRAKEFGRTDARGRLTIDRGLRYPVVAWDREGDRLGLVPVSAAATMTGRVRVKLLPACRITGEIDDHRLTDIGVKSGLKHLSLSDEAGVTLASASTEANRFEFLAPPGTYNLGFMAEHAEGRSVPVTVPKGRTELSVPPVELEPDTLTALRGKPALEFTDATGWRGKPVKLADLKGRLVLLEFWGYWCGPCLREMPTTIALHEKFAGRGLSVVGVHLDLDGEVKTAKDLEQRIDGFREEHWGGKDIPFPVALMSGVGYGNLDGGRRNTVWRYGVRGWPTSLLIDRQGKVIGKLNADNLKDASVRIEELLKEE